MFDVKRLAVSGHEGQPVANSLFKQHGQADRLVVVLPGLGYRCDGPLLWYPTKAALASGADVLWVEYAYDRRQDWMRSGARAQKEWLFEDAAAASKAVMDGRYEQVALIGKSLGTLAMGHLLSMEKFPDQTKGVWLTPVLSDSDLRRRLEAASVPSLLVIGTNDHYYDAAFLGGLRTKRATLVMEVDGADHSLEVEGDVIASIDVLKRVVDAVRRFIS